MMNKKNLYRWHRLAGLTLGFILFVLALSGALITYRDELLPLTYPEHFAVTPRSERAPLATQLLAAQAASGGQSLTHFYTAEADDTASMAFYRPTGALLPHLVTVDPYSAQVKGHMPLARNLFGVMLYLHANLLLGKVGGWVVGLMGLITCAFVLSGLYLWWPRRQLWQRLTQLPHQGVRGLHRALGFFFAPLLLLLGLTGFALSFDLVEVLARPFSGAKTPETQLALDCDLSQQLKALELLSAADQDHVVSLHLCSTKNGLMKITVGHDERSGHHGFTRLIVDPRTPQIVQRFDTRSDPASWHANSQIVYPLHTGASFGPVGRALVLLAGVALMGLFLTGLVPTLRKLRNSRQLSKKEPSPLTKPLEV